MSAGLLAELEIFFVSFGYGIAVVAVYDIIRIFRRVIAHGQVSAAVEDMIFWLWVTSLIFKMLYYRNDGALRLYIIFAAAAGMFLYSVSIGRYIVKYISVAMGRFLNYLFKPLKIAGKAIIIRFNIVKKRITNNKKSKVRKCRAEKKTRTPRRRRVRAQDEKKDDRQRTS